MKKIFTFFALLFAFVSSGQILDTDFVIGAGADNSVGTTDIQPDGKLIVSGSFVEYNGASVNRMARLNTDGTLDTGFNVGTGSSGIRDIAIQSDGKIIVGGKFSTFDQKVCNGITRLNTNGSLDNTFNTGSGAIATGSTAWIDAVCFQSDKKILIAGNFTQFNGTSRENIARLNADGTLDEIFIPKANLRMLGYIGVQSNGKIITVGQAKDYGKSQIVRLNADGSLDNDFVSGMTDETGSIMSVNILNDDKIVIAGTFVNYNGVMAKKITRLNADGSVDSNFNPISVINGDIIRVSVLPDNKMIVCGNFTNLNGIVRNFIGRLNADGSVDVGFDPGMGPNNYIYTTAVQVDGKVVIGGDFTSYNGTGRNRIARIKNAASLGLNDSKFENSIQIYPNPVSDILTIGSHENILPEIEIYDTLGKCVKTVSSFGGQIDVSSLSAGVYILKATDGKSGVYRSKFVKN